MVRIERRKYGNVRAHMRFAPSLELPRIELKDSGRVRRNVRQKRERRDAANITTENHFLTGSGKYRSKHMSYGRFAARSGDTNRWNTSEFGKQVRAHAHWYAVFLRFGNIRRTLRN